MTENRKPQASDVYKIGGSLFLITGEDFSYVKETGRVGSVCLPIDGCLRIGTGGSYHTVDADGNLLPEGERIKFDPIIKENQVWKVKEYDAHDAAGLRAEKAIVERVIKMVEEDEVSFIDEYGCKSRWTITSFRKTYTKVADDGLGLKEFWAR